MIHRMKAAHFTQQAEPLAATSFACDMAFRERRRKRSHSRTADVGGGDGDEIFYAAAEDVAQGCHQLQGDAFGTLMHEVMRTWRNPLNLLASRRFKQLDLTRRVRVSVLNRVGGHNLGSAKMGGGFG
jgi:hypothetical protein